MVDTAHVQQDVDGFPILDQHWSTRMVIGLLAGISAAMALLLGTTWWLCSINGRLDGTEEELDSFLSGAEKFLGDLFGATDGRDSLARRYRDVIKTRLEEAEGQISRLKLKLSGSRAPGMQFNNDSPHPPDPIPEYPLYTPAKNPGRLDYFRPKTRIAMRAKEGDGPGTGRGAQTEGDPEIEEGLAKLQLNPGIEGNQNCNKFSS